MISGEGEGTRMKSSSRTIAGAGTIGQVKLRVKVTRECQAAVSKFTFRDGDEALVRGETRLWQQDFAPQPRGIF